MLRPKRVKRIHTRKGSTTADRQGAGLWNTWLLGGTCHQSHKMTAWECEHRAPKTWQICQHRINGHGHTTHTGKTDSSSPWLDGRRHKGRNTACLFTGAFPVWYSAWHRAGSQKVIIKRRNKWLVALNHEATGIMKAVQNHKNGPVKLRKAVEGSWLGIVVK